MQLIVALPCTECLMLRKVANTDATNTLIGMVPTVTAVRRRSAGKEEGLWQKKKTRRMIGIGTDIQKMSKSTAESYADFQRRQNKVDARVIKLKGGKYTVEFWGRLKYPKSTRNNWKRW